jgi:hypothetical protein
MLCKRKPLEAEAIEFHEGMEDGIMAVCGGRHKVRCFDSEQHMETSGIDVKRWDFMILNAANQPVAVSKGDYLIDGVVWKKKDFDKEWEVFKRPGPGRKPGFSPKKKVQVGT